jgi:hypothetical protein
MGLCMNKISRLTTALLALSGFSGSLPASQAPDALTAATSTSLTPSFSGNLLAGPNVLAGNALTVGQELKLAVCVTNPWSNNTVSMTLNNQVNGQTLMPYSTNPSAPCWLLDWTPDATEVGTSTIIFDTTFLQTSGAARGTAQVYRASLPIKVNAGSSSVGNSTPAVRSLVISKAVWNAKTNVLTVGGTVRLYPGHTLPASTTVTLTYGDGSTITADTGAVINTISSHGAWTTTLTFTPGENPCSILGGVSVNGTDTTAVAAKKVTGKAASCR